MKKTLVQHLGQLDFLHSRENVILLGPPGTGTTHLAIAVGIRACLAGHRTHFATATEWVARLGDAQRQGRLAEELACLERIPRSSTRFGYIHFDPEAATLDVLAGLLALRARLAHRHLQQALLGLGRDLR